jgi:hypothetical protein
VPIIGITGGIASGKSSFVSRLSRLLGEKGAGIEGEDSHIQFRKRREAAEAPALSAQIEDGTEAAQTGPKEQMDGMDRVRTAGGVEIFDADAAARALVEGDVEVRDAILREFGAEALTP